jgi:hypothetical protein
MPALICPPPVTAPWRQYPYVLVPGDPELVFPGAEGHQDVATDTYYASGVLQGESSGRRYAFLTIFAKNERIFDLLSADLFVFALFDLDAGVYETTSAFDLPPGRGINDENINVTRGRLDVSFTSNTRESRVWTRLTEAGNPYPFAYQLDLRGPDSAGTDMQLTLCADALKPPQAVGGAVHAGRITVLGQPDTHSYFQSLGYSGTIHWRGIEERVQGRIGWLDRQWFPEYVGRYNGLLADRYAYQWFELSLDNGWEFGLWRQFDRQEDDRVVPYSGLTGTDPSGQTVFTDTFTVEIISYLRDPGLFEPLLADVQQLAGVRSHIRYFFDACRLRAPAFGLDLLSAPLVPAPAHLMPIDYFSGPTRLRGTMNGQAVEGFGFHERTLPLSRPPQLIIVLRDSLLHLPAEALAESLLTSDQLADLAWQASTDIERGRYWRARSYLAESVRPALLPIAEANRGHLLRLLDDLIDQLSFFA